MTNMIDSITDHLANVAEEICSNRKVKDAVYAVARFFEHRDGLSSEIIQDILDLLMFLISNGHICGMIAYQDFIDMMVDENKNHPHGTFIDLVALMIPYAFTTDQYDALKALARSDDWKLSTHAYGYDSIIECLKGLNEDTMIIGYPSVIKIETIGTKVVVTGVHTDLLKAFQMLV